MGSCPDTDIDPIFLLKEITHWSASSYNRFICDKHPANC